MLRVIEPLFIFLVAGIIFTQIILPSFRGTKTWPLFRREGKLESNIQDAKQQLRDQELEETVRRLEEKLGGKFESFEDLKEENKENGI